jgi:predicted DsbA family dithiol-disulfide isomerase
VSAGKEVGINFVGEGTINNTVDAHRLLAYADRLGKQAGVQSYHSIGRVVSHCVEGVRLSHVTHALTQHTCTHQVIEGLFTAHFEQGKNIGSIDVLAGIAKEAGLDEEQVRVSPRPCPGTFIQSHGQRSRFGLLCACADIPQNRGGS